MLGSQIKNTSTNLSKMYRNEIDFRLSETIALVYLLLIFNHSLKSILVIQETQLRQYISFIFYFAILIVFARSFYKYCKPALKDLLIYSIIFLTICCISVFIHPQNYYDVGLDPIFLIVLCLPLFTCLKYISDIAVLRQVLISKSQIIFIFSVIYIFGVDFSEYTYNMTFSYLILLPILVITSKVIDKFNLFLFFEVVFAVILVLIIGSRGPILSFVIYLVLKFILNNRKFNLIVIKIVFILMVFLVIYISSDVLINCLSDFFGRLGLTSRTVLLLLNFDNTDFSSGRIDIFNDSLTYISSNPIFGYGIFGDRFVLNGIYPHNIVLEWFMQFGLFIGSFIALFLIYLTINILFDKDDSKFDLFLIYFSLGFIPLLYTGSYIMSYNFWIYLGIILFNNKRKRINRILSNE